MPDNTPTRRASQPEGKAETPEQQKQRLYSAATRTVRENHRDEFQTTLAALYKAEGLEYKPRLTEEEKAEAKVRELLAKHPDLASKVLPQDAEPVPVEG